MHLNAAAAAVVAAVVIGKRAEYPSSSLLPHNVPFVLLGAGLLWFGWFGFNAGSALAASPIAGLAFITTMLAPAATLVVWTFIDVMRTARRPPLAPPRRSSSASSPSRPLRASSAR